jgi:hypothetical protein
MDELGEVDVEFQVNVDPRQMEKLMLSLSKKVTFELFGFKRGDRSIARNTRQSLKCNQRKDSCGKRTDTSKVVTMASTFSVIATGSWRSCGKQVDDLRIKN